MLHFIRRYQRVFQIGCAILLLSSYGSEFQLLQVALKPLRQTSIRGIECRVAAQGKEWEGADVMVFPNHV